MARKRGKPTPPQSLGVAKEPFITTLIGAAATAKNGLDQPAAERDVQVEDAFFRAAVALENFLSEWLVRCLSFDASVFRATYEKRAADWAVKELEDSYEPSGRLWKDSGATIRLEVELPVLKKHSLDATRVLLNAVDDNVPIRGTKHLVKVARDYLIDKYARRPTNLTRDRQAILDATIAIRNVVAHRSDRAAKQMNERLASGDLPSPLRRGSNRVSASKVGYHLQAATDDRPRFERYFEELAEIAHTLAPTRGRRRTICPWRSA
jgi:hypothetical protein